MPNFITRTHCPACKSTQAKVLLDLPYDSGAIFQFLEKKYKKMGVFEPELIAGGRYIISECLSCNLLFQQQRPTDELLATVYSKWIDYNAARVRDEASPPKTEQYNGELMILKKWAKQTKLKVFDYGMGHGRWLESAYTHGHEPFGYEYDAHRNSRPNALYTTIEKDDIGNYQFDFINTEQVFEHLAEPLETLQMLVKALRPGGLIRISVPTGIRTKGKVHQNMQLDFNKGQTKTPMGPLEPLQHLNCYAGKSTETMAAKCGLKPWFPPLSWQIGAQQDWSSAKKAFLNIMQPIKTELLYKHEAPMRYFVKPK